MHEGKCGMVEKSKEQEKTIQELEKQLEISQNRIESYEKLFQSQQDQIRELQNGLKNLASQGIKKHTNNVNNTLNLGIISEETLRQSAKCIQEKDFCDGIRGLAKFAVENSFKGRIAVTDASRKTLMYKDENGVYNKDFRGKNLIDMFIRSIIDESRRVFPIVKSVYESEMDNCCEAPVNNFIEVCGNMNELLRLQTSMESIYEGTDPELGDDFRNEFVGYVCDFMPGRTKFKQDCLS